MKSGLRWPFSEQAHESLGKPELMWKGPNYPHSADGSAVYRIVEDSGRLPASDMNNRQAVLRQ